MKSQIKKLRQNEFYFDFKIDKPKLLKMEEQNYQQKYKQKKTKLEDDSIIQKIQDQKNIQLNYISFKIKQRKVDQSKNFTEEKSYQNFQQNYKDLGPDQTNQEQYFEEQSLNPFKKNSYLKKADSKQNLNYQCDNYVPTQNQQKIFQKDQYFQEFTSFSHEKDFGKNFNQKNNEYKPFRQIIKNNKKYQGDFFFTNPEWTYDKNDQYQQIYGNHKNSQKHPQQVVHQFCFSLSSINQYPCPINLFSNSSENLFELKCSENNGSVSNRKQHIRKLVEEFVMNLDELDQKSLNQKAVNELEDVLESLIFKEKINQPNVQNYYVNRQLGNVKKWNKEKSGFMERSRQVLTERKYKNYYGMSLTPSNIIESNSNRDKIRKINLKQNQKYYHPNIPGKKQLLKNKQKENISMKREINNKSLVSLGKTNPKNGVYFKKITQSPFSLNQNLQKHR